MELAKQKISHDKTVRNVTVYDIKGFNSQSLAPQAKKGEQLVSMMPSIEKAFDLLGDDRVELSTKNVPLNNEIGSNAKCLKKVKAKLIKQIDDEKKTNLIKSRRKK